MENQKQPRKIFEKLSVVGSKRTHALVMLAFVLFGSTVVTISRVNPQSLKADVPLIKLVNCTARSLIDPIATLQDISFDATAVGFTPAGFNAVEIVDGVTKDLGPYSTITKQYPLGTKSVDVAFTGRIDNAPNFDPNMVYDPYTYGPRYTYITGTHCKLTLQDKLPAVADVIGQPQHVHTDFVTSGVKLSWDPLTGVDGYYVGVKTPTSNGQYVGGIGQSVGQATTFYNFPPAPPGTYWFDVVGYKGTSWGPIGQYTLVVPPAGAAPPATIAAPTNLHTEITTSGSNYIVKLIWNAVPGVDGYYIGVKTPASAGQYVGGIATVTTTSATFPPSPPGTYYVDVAAFKGTSWGALGSLPVILPVITQVAAKPDAPVLSGTVNNNKIILQWNAVTGASTYKVKSSLVSGSFYGVLKSGLTTTNYTDDQAIPGTTYYYVVTATSSSGESNQSNEIPVRLDVTSNQNTTTQNIQTLDNQTNQNNQNTTTQNLNNQNTNTSTTTTTSTDTTVVDNTPAPDIISCKTTDANVVFSTGKSMKVGCALVYPGLITAQIIKGTYAPGAAPAQSAIAKDLEFEKYTSDTALKFEWNGVDNYDATVDAGDYTFVISAKTDAQAKADYSLQKFKVLANLPVEQTQTPNEQTSVQQTTTQTVAQTKSTSTTQPQVQNTFHAAADKPAAPVPSKCPGVNYPKDIAGNWAEDLIKQAYDLCLFAGYKDGKFKPEQPISRAEAVKIVLSGANIKPDLTCKDASCGTGFKQLPSWASQWIKKAKDLKIIKGYSAQEFKPNQSITRSEFAVVLAKAFRLKAHEGCYTANCGAGTPNNFFLDIFDNFSGPYIRALWDLKIINGTAPNTFEPERPITRAEVAKVVLKLRAAKLEALHTL